MLGPQGVVRNLNFSLSTEAMLHNVNSVLVFFFPPGSRILDNLSLLFMCLPMNTMNIHCF